MQFHFPGIKGFFIFAFNSYLLSTILDITHKFFQFKTDLGRERKIPELPAWHRLQLRKRLQLQRHLRQELGGTGNKTSLQAEMFCGKEKC